MSASEFRGTHLPYPLQYELTISAVLSPSRPLLPSALSSEDLFKAVVEIAKRGGMTVDEYSFDMKGLGQ